MHLTPGFIMYADIPFAAVYASARLVTLCSVSDALTHEPGIAEVSSPGDTYHQAVCHLE